MEKEISPDKISFFSSITFRLILIVALIVLLFRSIGILIAISNTEKQITDVIQRQQLSFAKYISNSIDIEISKSISFFTSLGNELSEKDSTAESLSDPKWIVGRHIPPNFEEGLVLISPNGKGLISEHPIVPGRKDLSFVQSEWFQRAKLADQAIISKPFRNRITQEPSVVFAAPIKNSKNEVIAVVASIVGLKQPELFKYVYNSPNESSSGVLIVSPEDKLFVASNIPEMVLKPTPEPGRNKLHDMAMNGYRGVGVTVNAYGIEELSAITSVESTGWFVVVRLPVSEAYLPVKHLSKTLITYNLLLTTAVILATLATLTTMLSPLKKAALSVRKMAHGHLPLDKLPIARKDEVGDLIDGFNSLVDTIDEQTNELKIANRKLTALSITDGLTGLGNRRFFDEKLEQEWSRASRTCQPLALGMIDIDWFKKYNDHYGHQMGDECLKKVSNVLASCINRTGDISARYGGEEFVFIAPATDADGARAIAEKFRETLQLLVLPHEESEFGFVSASIGVAVMTPTKEQDAISLVKGADKALYLAKEQGRNRVVLFS